MKMTNQLKELCATYQLSSDDAEQLSNLTYKVERDRSALIEIDVTTKRVTGIHTSSPTYFTDMVKLKIDKSVFAKFVNLLLKHAEVKLLHDESELSKHLGKK